MAKSKSRSTRRSTPKPKAGARPPAKATCSNASPPRLNGWPRGARPCLTLAPPMLSCGTRTAGLRRLRASTASRCRCSKASTASRRVGGKYRALRQRPARQQRAALGRARHGQVVAGEGRACRRQCRLRTQQQDGPLKLIEIHREDIDSLPELMALTRGSRIALSCSATICRSTPRTRPTSRSKRCWKAASKAGRTTSSSTPPRTAAI